MPRRLAKAAEARGAGEPAAVGRLQVRADGGFVDTWTGRPVECVPLSEAVVTRARCFAAADHAALQTVLRIDREGGHLWLAACAAPIHRSPTDVEQLRVRSALDALIAAGLDPACLDPTALAIGGEGAVVVRF